MNEERIRRIDAEQEKVFDALYEAIDKYKMATNKAASARGQFSQAQRNLRHAEIEEDVAARELLEMMDSIDGEDNAEDWESGKLGCDEEHARLAPDNSNAVDEALMQGMTPEEREAFMAKRAAAKGE